MKQKLEKMEDLIMTNKAYIGDGTYLFTPKASSGMGSNIQESAQVFTYDGCSTEYEASDVAKGRAGEQAGYDYVFDSVVNENFREESWG